MLIPIQLRWLILFALIASGFSVNAQQTVSLTQKAAAGDLSSQYKLGEAYLKKGETGQAVVWLRKAADRRYMPAELALAEIYQQGTGVPSNDQAAFHWYLEAADQGNDRAQTIVGIDYKFGESGAPKDIHTAARWFRKAAHQGNVEAQTNLTELLGTGLITTQEASWEERPPSPEGGEPSRSKSFALSEVEKGLTGGITSKRLATLVMRYGVNFELTETVRKQLSQEGADDSLLTAISSVGR